MKKYIYIAISFLIFNSSFLQASNVASVTFSGIVKEKIEVIATNNIYIVKSNCINGYGIKVAITNGDRRIILINI